MKISTRLIGKQLRGGGGSFVEEKQKKNTAAGKYFLDYYQGLRSPVTAKYCSSIFLFFFFFFSLLCGKQGKPVERGGRLLLIGRKRGFRPPACMREREVEERVYKCKRKKTSVCIYGRPMCDWCDTNYREEWICVDGPAKECHRLTPGENRSRGLWARYRDLDPCIRTV